MKKFFLTIISVSTLILLFFYIFQVNVLTEETYFIKSCEKKLTQLSRENEALEIDFSKAGSLSNIESYLQSQNFEKVSQVKYIYILAGSVATSQ